MEYNDRFRDFLVKNVDSHEIQLFSVSRAASAILDFQLYLKGNSGGINFGEIIIESVPCSRVFNNESFIRWMLVKLGSDNLNCSPSEFHEKLNDKAKAKKTLKKYFGLKSASRKIKKTNTSTIVRPFSKKDFQDVSPSYLEMHDFQIRVKDDMTRVLRGKGNSRLLVQMPTGSGKTRTAIEYIIDHIRTNSCSSYDHNIYMWFTNSVELCEQALETFKEFWRYKGDRVVGVHRLYGDSSSENLYNSILNENVSIVFIGFQKFNSLFDSKKISESRLLQMFRENNVLSVVDEAHISLANTYDHAIEYVSEFYRSSLIGLTATPGRNSFVVGESSNALLAQKFHKNIVQIHFSNGEEYSPIELLQNLGYLAKVEINEIENISNLKASVPIDQLAFDSKRNIRIVEIISDRVEANKSILVFSASTEHSVVLSACLKSVGVYSEVVDANTSRDVRTSSIESFKKGNLKVLINYGVLSTGFDAPILDCLLIARPISSIVLYSQIVGRALRGPLNGGNDKNEIIVIKDRMVNYPDPSFLYSYWDLFWD